MRVVVTGAGSGFGLGVARALLGRGDSVVACDLSTAGLADRMTRGLEGPAAVAVHALDLRDPGAIATVTAAVSASGPVDGVVLNAGYGLFNALEDGDLDAVGALLDANVLGTARVMRGLLQAVRAARGTIVVVSSVAGRMVFPESGFYAAAKHGLEALAEGWYVENAASGVRVVVVEPGAFDTGFAGRAQRASAPRSAAPVRMDDHAAWDGLRQAMLSSPQDPAHVVGAIVEGLDAGPSFQRRAVGEDAARILAARDAIGRDTFVRLMGECVGGPRDPGLPTPAQVLAGLDPIQVAQLRAAASAGLLAHWRQQPDGAEALARLGRG